MIYGLDTYPLPGLEKISFTAADGTQLQGWFVPGSNGATLILCHGLQGDRREMLPDAKYLQRADFSVLLFDFRYRGESSGDAQTFGAKEVWDIRAAMAYLKSREDVNPERIGIQGISMGGAAAILAAAEMPDLRGVLAEITFPSLHGVIDHSFPKMAGLPVWPFAGVTKWIAEMRTG